MLREERGNTYYSLLNLPPWATVQQIRRAYREMSKLYHPDTTSLPPAIATARFQELNDAYATLSSPERRVAYDLKIGYSRFSVIQPSVHLDRPVSDSHKYRSRSAYLDPTDRPLSPGEIFALFILGLTFIACLLLVITIGVARGEIAIHPAAHSQRLRTPVQSVNMPMTHLSGPNELDLSPTEPRSEQALTHAKQQSFSPSLDQSWLYPSSVVWIDDLN
ncbi:MAG: J domain-containing protein [Elainellaceae cyanobacterium]